MSNKTMILMRGWPGSGKSTKAQEILDFFKNLDVVGVKLSTDEYFVVNDEYVFVPSLIGEAHKWNQWRAQKYVDGNLELIIIDNTNIKLWEMEAYIKMAQAKKYDVFQYVCSGEFENTHGVPDEVVQKMKNNFEESDLPHWNEK